MILTLQYKDIVNFIYNGSTLGDEFNYNLRIIKSLVIDTVMNDCQDSDLIILADINIGGPDSLMEVCLPLYVCLWYHRLQFCYEFDQIRLLKLFTKLY